MRKKKKNRIFIYILLAVLIVSLIVFLKSETEKKTFTQKIENYEETDVYVQPGVVFLIKDCRALPVFISEEQSFSIFQAINKEKPLRPLTHDLFKNFIEKTETELLLVKIDSLKNSTYYATLVFEDFELDARPSDALALAIRLEKSVFVSKELIYSDITLDICEKPKFELRNRTYELAF